MSEAILPDHLARTVAEPRSYADWDRLHDAFKIIRRDYPFARAALDDYPRFWVASKFDDIRAITRDSTTFLSGMQGVLSLDEMAFFEQAGINELFRSVVHMNAPEHQKFRALTQAWFQPKNVNRLTARIQTLADKWVDRMAELAPRCDFVKEIGVHYPLFVIMAILGIPDTDEDLMLRLTQEYFGNQDDELNAVSADISPETAAAGLRQVVLETNRYFGEISKARRADPRDDLASVIANAVVDGAPISDLDAMGYYITVAFAGHDTTSSSIAGALWALAENPQELAKLQANPALIPNLVEEAVRWTSPIQQFTRVAARDTEFAGQPVKAGDQVVLCFPSGNRDEDAIEEPFRFRVDRDKPVHVGFGHGPHICLGMYLARLEMEVFFRTLLPRLRHIELAGRPTRMVTNFVGGPKSLPISFSFTQ